MIVLGLDGALGRFSAAVVDGDAVLAQREEQGARALESGLGVVAEVLRRAAIDRRDLSRIGVGIGPGSFTGLRIAISYAKALALAWRIPLVPIGSFDLLESGPERERVLAVVGTRAGFVCARFRERASTAQACGPVREVLDRLLPSPLAGVTLFGDAQDVLAALAERGVEVQHVDSPLSPAVAAATLARSRKPAPSPHEVRPDYGELPAAKVPHFS